MKKLLLLAAFCAFGIVSAQINPNAPWVKALDLENRSTQPKGENDDDRQMICSPSADT